MTCQESSLLVAGVEWVDEGVDSGTVGAVWNSEVVGLSWSNLLRGELGSVGVESEVTVSGVVGVDEWVEVGVDWFVSVVVVNGLGDSLEHWSSGLDWSRHWGWSSLGGERS